MTRDERELIRQSWAPKRRWLRPSVSSTSQLAVLALRWETVEATLRVHRDAGAALEAARRALATFGDLDEAASGDAEVVATVGTGVLGLNKAVVTVAPGPDRGPGGTSLSVRVVSPEGLVRTHGASAALDRLVATLAPPGVVVESRTATVGWARGAPGRAELVQALGAGVMLAMWILAVAVWALGSPLAANVWVALGCTGGAVALGARIVAARARRDRGRR